MTNAVACWVNVESGAGARLGDGPIVHVVNWTSTALLSKAGTFSLVVAAGDPRAALLQPKRVVRCFALVNGALAEIGAGIIDTIRWDGATLLEVTGSDLLAELRYRSVHDLNLVDETQHTPAKVFSYVQVGSVWTDMVAAYDGVKVFGVANRVSFDLNTFGDFLYIGYSAPFNVLYTYQDLGAGGTTFNAVPSDLNYGYSDGAGHWPELKIVSDTQIVGGVPWPASLANRNPITDLAHPNTVLFQRNSNWHTETVNGVANLYWIRVDPTANLGAVSIVEFEIGKRFNLAADVGAVMAYAPAAWASWAAGADGVTVFNRTTEGTYAAFAGELVLNALTKIAERAGENFRLGAGRTLHWLHTATGYAASGARAVMHTGSVRQDANAAICQIVALEETRDTNDLVTRVYPFGAGNGKARVTMVNATLAMPSADYVMDTANNYIRRVSAETTYGQIERIMAFSDVRSTDDAAFDGVEVCNQLAQLTLNWLQRNSEINYFYRLQVTGLHQVLKVGTTIRVIYREVHDGVVTVDIDDDLIILSETHTFAAGEAYTVAMDVGTTDTWPATDTEIIADMIENGTVYESHPQAVDSAMIKTVV
jgi:hypothetical protein